MLCNLQSSTMLFLLNERISQCKPCIISKLYNTMKVIRLNCLLNRVIEDSTSYFFYFVAVAFTSGATIIVPWTDSLNQDSVMISKRIDKIFSCVQENCGQGFLREDDLFKHMSYGHRATTDTCMDKILTYFVSKKNLSANPHLTTIPQSRSDSQMAGVSSDLFPRGFARKTRKKSTFSSKQKDFIRELYEEGETTNRKLNPDEIAAKMRTQINESGEYTFQPTEYLTNPQIKGLISRFNIGKTGNKKKARLEESDGIVADLETICSLVCEDLD